MKKIESLKRIIILQLSVIGIIIDTAIYAFFWFEEYYPVLARRARGLNYYFRGHVLVILIYFVLILFFTSTFGGLKVGYLKPGDIIFSQIFGIIAVNLISYFQLSLMGNWLVPIKPMLLCSLVQFVFSAIWTVMCNAFYHRVFPPRKILFVHGDRPIEDILYKFSTRPDKYLITDTLNISEGMDKVKETGMSGKFNGVVLWDIPTQYRNKLLKFFYSNNMRVYMMPKITDVLVQGSDSIHLFDAPILLTREYALTAGQRFAKRTMDIVCALLLAIIASPIMLITAIFIKLYDGGPVLYSQIRCTRDRREFRILKFRSMRVDAEKDGVARLASKGDDRITPIGRFIRAVRIDELPQLFNILKGDMSFIGPRPERPEIIEQYMDEMPEFAYRMRVKAGLAGYAQVYGRYNTTPYDKLKLDLIYIENYSFWMDIKLMLLTLKILLKPESTEGVETNQVTAMKNPESVETEDRDQENI
ncbi:MAG: exopolysaccharide biosynthesis polyprenyl glycosylphosphotransferase [Lachnospiraceae bacterium]|nr:exopolysaccharide biosynthesis polyprenyl glycosylphosphotransferase [Lachnospiraceae bacterium]